MHLDSPVVSSGIPVTLPKTNWLKKIFFLPTKMQVDLYCNDIPSVPDINIFLMIKAAVGCNTHLDKLPTKPNQSALNSWVRQWILSPKTS